jgi:hypothetical protein
VLSEFGELALDSPYSTINSEGSGGTAKYTPFSWALHALAAAPHAGGFEVPNRAEATPSSVELVALPPSSSGLRGFVSRWPHTGKA